MLLQFSAFIIRMMNSMILLTYFVERVIGTNLLLIKNHRKESYKLFTFDKKSQEKNYQVALFSLVYSLVSHISECGIYITNTYLIAKFWIEI